MSNLTTKRSRRLLSSKSPPLMEALETMRKPNQSGEMFHFSHPYHSLLPVTLPYIFTCNGCEEYGAGKRYRCKLMCEFDLHDFCALAPPTIQNHPLHYHHQLVFLTKSGGFIRSKCDICGKATKGYAFCCTSCSFQMHPCCATMNGEMDFPTHQHPLILLPSAGGESGFVCGICCRKRSGRFYSCFACGYYLHAVCAKEMVNGLYVHGYSRPPHARTNMLGTAAKLATNALFAIIGGLIEGIGEGIGGVLMDNIGRGRSTKLIKK